MYVAGYTFARFFIEGLRIDSANELLGLRVNEWVSALVFLTSAGFLVIDWWQHRNDAPTAVVDTEPRKLDDHGILHDETTISESETVDDESAPVDDEPIAADEPTPTAADQPEDDSSPPRRPRREVSPANRRRIAGPGTEDE
jgi:hypothetical protein